MDWSPQQARALDAVAAWYRDGPSRPFILNGYAGTGKTSLARHLAETIGGLVPFVTLTGKAAHVLRKKGCATATTVHQLIYRPKHKSRSRLLALQDQLAAALASDSGGAVSDLTHELELEKRRLDQPAFALVEDAGSLAEASAVIVDEHSMIDARVGADLCSFGVPIIALGDPGQLPPVGGRPFFDAEPDVMLDEIHRQARGDPIIRLATAARRGEELPYGEHGESRVVPWGSIDPQEALAHDQILVGRNATRTATNSRVRELRGRASPYPEGGERVVCLRNNHDLGVMNGSTWETTGPAVDLGDDRMALELSDGERSVWLEAYAAAFRGEKVSSWDRDAELFDYGYAITVHKAQGSDWPSVLVFDESWAFRQDRHRHLYTAITRAAERVTVVR